MRNNLEEYWEQHNEDYKTQARYSTWAFKKLLDGIELRDKKCIDIGCGYGLLLQYMQNRGAVCEGLELCSNVARKVKDFKIIEGDCRDMPIESNTYDLVTSFGVIEHLWDWRQAVREHFRICKPNGTVIISVPYLFSPIYPTMAIYYLPQNIKYGLRIVTGKPFTKNELVKEMAKYGKIVETKVFDFCCLLEPLTKSLHINLAKFLEKCFGRFGVMIYCTAKKEAKKK